MNNKSYEKILATDYSIQTLINRINWKLLFKSVFTYSFPYYKDGVFMSSTGLSDGRQNATLPLSSVSSLYYFCKNTEDVLQQQYAGIYLLDWVCIIVYILCITSLSVTIYYFSKKQLDVVNFIIYILIMAMLLIVCIFLQINLHKSQDIDDSTIDYFVINVLGLAGSLQDIKTSEPFYTLPDRTKLLTSPFPSNNPSNNPIIRECICNSKSPIQTITFNIDANWDFLETNINFNMNFFCNALLKSICKIDGIKIKGNNVKVKFFCEMDLCTNDNCIGLSTFRIKDQIVDMDSLQVVDIDDANCLFTKSMIQKLLNSMIKNIKESTFWDLLFNELSDELNNLILQEINTIKNK